MFVSSLAFYNKISEHADFRLKEMILIVFLVYEDIHLDCRKSVLKIMKSL